MEVIFILNIHQCICNKEFHVSLSSLAAVKSSTFFVISCCSKLSQQEILNKNLRTARQ